VPVQTDMSCAELAVHVYEKLERWLVVHAFMLCAGFMGGTDMLPGSVVGQRHSTRFELTAENVQHLHLFAEDLRLDEVTVYCAFASTDILTALSCAPLCVWVCFEADSRLFVAGSSRTVCGRSSGASTTSCGPPS